MQKFLSFIFILLIFSAEVFAQSTENYAVSMQASVQENPPEISIYYKQDNNAASYSLYRKLSNSSSWGPLIASLPVTDSVYTDTTISVGQSYEYKIIKQGNVGSNNFTGYGYINAGIKVPVIENRGRIILLIDSSHSTALSAELNQLVYDLTGDGWIVDRQDVSPLSTVPYVKSLIVNSYNLFPLSTKAVFLFGDIPVPYSGQIYPDGHPNHEGAWPSDCFYGDIDGAWTDNTVNVSAASDPRNHNIPGDGKFDQSLFVDLELQVGRVDLSNLPSFLISEQELLRAYLIKNHRFRHKVFDCNRQAVIDDNFTSYNEAFAANGYRNFPAFFGDDKVFDADYFTSLKNDNFLWSYGCGAGTHTSCSGVVTTSGFVGDSLGSVFTMLFGSYFGDWDRNDNLLRAALASGSTLSNCWAGRPNWYFHHMAMGENIGYSTLLSQNNSSLYHAGLTGRWVHSALMGDPTLRMHIVAPVMAMSLDTSGYNVEVNWTASADSVLGYYVYRKGSSDNEFSRINTVWINDTTFVDSCVFTDTYSYMVRALKLEHSASGSYYNLSQGTIDSINVINNFVVTADFSFTVFSDSTVIINNLSSIGNTSQFHWDMGDSSSYFLPSPIHTYASNGTYTILLTVYNGCSIDTISKMVTISVNTSNNYFEDDFVRIFPNPTEDFINLEFKGEFSGDLHMQLMDVTGKIHWSSIISQPLTKLSTINLSSGVYFVRLLNEKKTIFNRTLIKY